LIKSATEYLKHGMIEKKEGEDLMTEKWKVVINGEVFEEEATRANWAIHNALHHYKGKHGQQAYSMTQGLTINVTRGNGKPFPFSKVV
jgi:hypothetical protein